MLQKRSLERAILWLSGGVWLLIGLMLVVGDPSRPRLRSVNWQDRTLSKRDTVLQMMFTRPMDQAAVEAEFAIEPPLAGRFRWLGRRLTFNLTEPLPYGESFTLRLPPVPSAEGTGETQAFEMQFQTRDRQFVGIDPEGRLVHYNLSQNTAQVLTELRVVEFGLAGDDVYFIAFVEDVREVFRVNLRDPQPERLLDGEQWINFRLRVSPDGSVVIVERLNREQLGQNELWQLVRRNRFEPLDVPSGGDFLLAPDNSTLVMAQGQGLGIIALGEQTPPDFLPQYGQVLAIRPDGTAAALVRFNEDFTRTLAVASITGETFELAPSQGSLQQAAFAPMQPRLFLSRGRLDPETFEEFPELLAFDWETGLEVPLARSDESGVLHFSLSPDGRELLYSLSSLDTRTVTALWHLDLGQRPVVATPLDVQLRDIAWVP